MLTYCDFFPRPIESQNTIRLILASFAGVGIDAGARRMVFGRVKDPDDREWLALWEVLDTVHTSMYRLKHFGNRTLREGADRCSVPLRFRTHRTVKSSRIIARSEQHLYRVVWFLESVTSHHGPLSQPSNPSWTRRHPLPHSHQPTVSYDHSMGWHFYQHVTRLFCSFSTSLPRMGWRRSP